MRNLMFVVAMILVGGVQSRAPQLPAPPLFVPIASVAPVGSAAARGLPTLAPMLKIADQLARFGKVARGQLGVSMQDLPASMPVAPQSSVQAGAMIADVALGSPAEKAGLRRGDLIIAMNGNPIVSTAQRRARVGLVRVGQTVTLDFMRNGERLKVNATVAEPIQR
jgi:membrane-associated protease RseP (regulator of RpoE activity)